MGNANKLNQKVKQAEAEVRYHSGSLPQKYMNKAEVLAEWLANRKEKSNNLQRNDYAIA